MREAGFVSCDVEGENGIEGKGEAGSHPPLTAGNVSWQRKQCSSRCRLETLALGSVRWPAGLGSMCWHLTRAIGVWALNIGVGPETSGSYALVFGSSSQGWALCRPYALALGGVGFETSGLGPMHWRWVRDVWVGTYALTLGSRCLVSAVHVGVMLYALALG